MSNILIIKHGSLGDIVQISGVIKDIRKGYQDKKIFILTTYPYIELLSKCPYVDGIILDKRLPRWNLLYLVKLKKNLENFNFEKVIDLQNSSRTFFYKKYLLNIKNWSNSEVALEKNQRKEDFDNNSVLSRFKIQLEKSNIKSTYTLRPDFGWSSNNVDTLVNQYFSKKYILIFPFCSPSLSHKKWPHFNKLIEIIKSKHSNFEIAVAPGPNETDEAKKINATIVLKNNNFINLMDLSGLIQGASYIISNDTGPAHMAAHLGKSGTVIFGHHTTPKKVSIETEKFKSISSTQLKLLSPETVYLKIKDKLDLIN